MTDLYPIPDAEGIANTKELYLNRFGKTLTDEQAAEVLGRVMRFLFYTSELTAQRADVLDQRAEPLAVPPAGASPTPLPVAPKS